MSSLQHAISSKTNQIESETDQRYTRILKNSLYFYNRFHTLRNWIFWGNVKGSFSEQPSKLFNCWMKRALFFVLVDSSEETMKFNIFPIDQKKYTIEHYDFTQKSRKNFNLILQCLLLLVIFKILDMKLMKNGQPNSLV